MKFPEIDSELVKDEITTFIKNILDKAGADGIVIGLSGGIDSSVVAFLLKEAIGKNNVYSYHLHSSTTPKEDTEHARAMSKLLDIYYKEINIDTITNEFLSLAKDDNASDISEDLASEGNLKARIRMTMLYYFANMKNCLVAGTGNKSELLIGYFTKYGDGACDFEPIGDIYKTQLRKLAKEWNIPDEIIDKPPRAGLWIGQTDEDEIGLTYDVLDKLLYLLIDKQLEDADILEEVNISKLTLVDLKNRINNNEHKLEFPPSPFEEKKLF